jgi:hypothetical protein
MKQIKEECPRSGLVKQNEERHKLCLSGEKLIREIDNCDQISEVCNLQM